MNRPDIGVFWRNARAAYLAIGLIPLGLIGVGLILQHVIGLEPCPLCIFQRIAFLGVALFGLLAAAIVKELWRSLNRT